MLSIHNLHVAIGETEILKGLSLDVPAGEVHAVMGPNGAGKSTLSYTLAGRPGYEVTNGSAPLRACSYRSSIRLRFQAFRPSPSCAPPSTPSARPAASLRWARRSS